ncbi:MAG: hypothetical protein LBN43_04755 [Oscillospiraceae bacterium]|jgi:hypothetical protein|nr:hypothetical protein [Oscillospiraceae bacterium]
MQKNNVLALERAILDGSSGDVERILKSYGPFEFTARALAISMRFGDAEKTDLLLKAGAMTDYDRNSNILRLEYNTIYSTSEIWGSDYPANYSLFPVFDKVTERYLFFGTLYEPRDGEHLLMVDGIERSPAPERVRAESIETICRHNALDDYHKEELLYYANLFGCVNISKVLRDNGVTLNASRDVCGGYVRLISSFDDITVAVRETLKSETRKNKVRFEVNDGMVSYLLRYESWLTNRWNEFLTILICGDVSDIGLDAVAEKLVELDADDKLADLKEYGLLSDAGKHIERAIDSGKNRALAFLMNAKNEKDLKL